MSKTLLSFEQSPPFSVPAPYFAVAPLFAMAAGLLLCIDPELMQSRWMPATLAITHLLTLGFFAPVMMGAFQQLLPVVAGAAVPCAVLSARIILATLASGTAALVGGLAAGTPMLATLALALLGASFTLFLSLAGWSLFRASSRHPTIRAMATALAALAITVALGLTLAAGHAGFMPLLRQFTDHHLAWGAVGWIALLVMGVAWQVVPMFQMTPDYPRRLVGVTVPVTVAALLFFALFFETWGPWAALPPALLMAAFAVTTLRLQRQRRRRLPDVTVAFWQMGMFSLLAAVALWPGAALAGLAVPPLLVGILFLVGFGMSVINGMLYKIVPFLVWLHLNNLAFTTGWRGEVPTMKQVIPEAAARRQLLVSRIALCFLVPAALFPREPLVRMAGLAFTLSCLLLAANLWSAVAIHRRLRREWLALPEAVG